MSLLAWYKLNDNAANTVVADASGNGNHGTAAANTDTKTAIGKVGRALTFNGTTDQVTLGSLAIASNAPFTAALWHYITSFIQAYPEPIRLQDSNSAVCFEVGLSTATNWLGHFFGGNGAGWCRRKSNVPSASFVGVWAHYAITYNGAGATTPGNFVLYYNGSVQDTNEASSFTAQANTSILSPQQLGWTDLAGLLDDVRLYNEALTAAQIKAICNAGMGSSRPYPWNPTIVRPTIQPLILRAA